MHFQGSAGVHVENARRPHHTHQSQGLCNFAKHIRGEEQLRTMPGKLQDRKRKQLRAHYQREHLSRGRQCDIRLQFTLMPVGVPWDHPARADNPVHDVQVLLAAGCALQWMQLSMQKDPDRRLLSILSCKRVLLQPAAVQLMRNL